MAALRSRETLCDRLFLGMLGGVPERVFLLDIGGVILSDAMRPLHRDLATSGGLVSPDEITAFYTTHLRARLWNGQLPEVEFWRQILKLSGAAGGVDEWRRHLLSLSTPLPAAARLPELAATGVVAAVSNHRHEWLLPLLERYDLRRHFTALFISDLTGLVKPNPAAVSYACRQLAATPKLTVFVDDHEENLLAAESRGVATVRADTAGRWVQTLLDGTSAKAF